MTIFAVINTRNLANCRKRRHVRRREIRSRTDSGVRGSRRCGDAKRAERASAKIACRFLPRPDSRSHWGRKNWGLS